MVLLILRNLNRNGDRDARADHRVVAQEIPMHATLALYVSLYARMYVMSSFIRTPSASLCFIVFLNIASVFSSMLE